MLWIVWWPRRWLSPGRPFPAAPNPERGPEKPFEPPKYVWGLIDAINESAKPAQTGMLLLSGVGIYLLATAFTADEDLLLRHNTSIAQLGVQVPIVFAFVIAPLVFVVLHGFMLVRHDMLATNLRQNVTRMR